MPAAGGGGAAAGGGGAGGGAAGAVAAAGAGGALIVGFVALAAVAVIVGAALTKLGMQGYETALRLAKFDGSLSGAKAQLDVNRLLRDIQTARVLSKPGAEMMGSVNKSEETLRPLTDQLMAAGMELVNVLLPVVVSGLQSFVGAISGAIKGLDWFANQLGRDIDDKVWQRLDAAAAGRPAMDVNNFPAGGLHAEFLKLPAAAPPRPPLPPLGGQNP